MPEDPTRSLTLSQAAKALGVHPNTVRNWVNRGQVPAMRLPSGHRRFTRDQIEAIKEQMGMGKAAA
jgi:excisionase family DNA binding protein